MTSCNATGHSLSPLGGLRHDDARISPHIVVAIYALMARLALEGRTSGPEEVERMVIAYEKALSVLALKRGDDPANRLVAEKIIKVAQMGERDPEQICRRAIAELSRKV